MKTLKEMIGEDIKERTTVYVVCYTMAAFIIVLGAIVLAILL